MRKWSKRFLLFFIFLFFILLAYFYSNVRDRHPGYSIDVSVKSENPDVLKVGFSAVKISPLIHDSWNDVNGDAQYNAAEMAVEEINATGGILGKEVQLVLMDSQSKSDVAKSNVEAMIDNEGQDER